MIDSLEGTILSSESRGGRSNYASASLASSLRRLTQTNLIYKTHQMKFQTMDVSVSAVCECSELCKDPQVCVCDKESLEASCTDPESGDMIKKGYREKSAAE